MVAARLDTRRRIERTGPVETQILIGYDQAAGNQKRWKKAFDKTGDSGILGAVPGTDIGMDQGNPAGETLDRAGQRLVNITQDQKPGPGIDGHRRVDPALEHKDLPVRQDRAQMVIGPAMTEAELENRARQVADHPCRQIETPALRLEPAYEAVQAAQGTR